MGAYIRSLTQEFQVQDSIGAFFGATEDAQAPVADQSRVDAFIDWLRSDHSGDHVLAGRIAALTAGTVLARPPSPGSLNMFASDSAEALERLVTRWRQEYAELLSRGAAANEAETRNALTNRAKRMRGEYLLGELARRLFLPAYGFPVDVVSFDHLSGQSRNANGESAVIAYGDRRGGASRPLDTAIREYAPGAEVVVDGLVHRSDGIMPAWGAAADTSRLEDLQTFWDCEGCHAFGVLRMLPATCPACGRQEPRRHPTLRPSGFLGRRAPHTGYENLGHVAWQMSRVQAFRAAWRALPDPAMGRLRADPVGQVVAQSAGANGYGYALCLACGRAEAETEELSGAPLPAGMKQHLPLARGAKERLVAGFCPGGVRNLSLIQRNVRLVHDAFTDVFELQTPAGTARSAALALAAGLREALAERLGTEVREIGVGIGPSAGPADEKRLSLFLHDRASGGAGLVTRLADMDWFHACLSSAVQRLTCPQECRHGCPSCVLRPDLGFADARLDRPAGLELATELKGRLNLPEPLQVFGPDSRILGQDLTQWLDRQQRRGSLQSATIFLHGVIGDWELADWPLAAVLPRLRQAGASARLVIPKSALADAELDLAHKLDLHRLAVHADLAYMTGLPTARTAPILAIVQTRDGFCAIAGTATEDSVPGPDWGKGATSPLVHAPAVTLPRVDVFDSASLITVSAGNAHFVRLRDQLDGPVGNFGQAFWKIVAQASPVLVTAIQAHGVKIAHYSDRYLLTPLTARLLFEVLQTLPTRTKGQISVATVCQQGIDRPGSAIYDHFTGDVQRQGVLQALLPGASVRIQSRNAVPHARSLSLTLGDERRIVMHLDQGFGAWRAEGRLRHDFNAEPAAQARALRRAVFKVRADSVGDVPMVIEQG